MAENSVVLKTTQVVLTALALLSIIYVVWYLKGLAVAVFVGFLISAVIRLVAFNVYEKTSQRFSLKFWYTLFFILFYAVFITVILQVMFIFFSEVLRFLRELQTTGELSGLEQFLGTFFPSPVRDKIYQAIGDAFSRIVNLEVTVAFASFILETVPYFLFVIFASWYLLHDREKIIESVLLPIRKSYFRRRLFYVLYRLEEELGKWAQGQILLMLIIGIFIYLGLWILGVKYALSLAVIAGVLEVVPTFGPLLSSIPAIFVALVSGGPIKALWVALLYYLIQQIENSFLVPRVMGSVVGVHPFFVILAIMTGQALFGTLGAVLAVPIYVFINTLFMLFRKEELLNESAEGKNAS